MRRYVEGYARQAFLLPTLQVGRCFNFDLFTAIGQIEAIPFYSRFLQSTERCADQKLCEDGSIGVDQEIRVCTAPEIPQLVVLQAWQRHVDIQKLLFTKRNQ